MTKHLVTCAGPYCRVQFEQKQTGRPRRFCSARCRKAANRQKRFVTFGPNLHLVWNEAMRDLGKDFRSYGGHLERNRSSVIDGVRGHAEIAPAIDRKLVYLLGGIPQPWAPRADVLELRGPSVVNLDTVAA